MRLPYLSVQFRLSFDRPVLCDVYPPFVLRSLLGKELRELVCLLKANQCRQCALRFNCVYSLFFETPVDKTTGPLSGRDRAAHPYVLHCDTAPGQQVQILALGLTLIGRAVEFLPYVYLALSRAGRKGAFRERAPFRVQKIIAGGRDILVNETTLDVPAMPSVWSSGQPHERRPAHYNISLRSPLRLKYNGRYGLDFSARDLFARTAERAVLLCKLYGDRDIGQLETLPGEQAIIINRMLAWTDYRHWSSRQKTVMLLGGATGSFCIQGRFSEFEHTLLDFAALFHTGKNPGFGLGAIDSRRTEIKEACRERQS